MLEVVVRTRLLLTVLSHLLSPAFFYLLPALYFPLSASTIQEYAGVTAPGIHSIFSKKNLTGRALRFGHDQSSLLSVPDEFRRLQALEEALDPRQDLGLVHAKGKVGPAA